MDVAAQQVQGEVQGIACQRDDEEHDDVAGNGAQGVEHLRNDAARQHQGHQTGVREDVSEIPGDVIVQRTEDPGNFAEALVGQHRYI